MHFDFYCLAVLCYACGTISLLVYIISLRELFSRIGSGLLSAGFVLHTVALIFRYYAAGYLPVTNLHESFSFFGWAVVLVYLAVNYKYRIPVMGAFVAPVVLIFSIIGLALPKEILPLHPALKSYWLPFHVIFAFLGDAVFALAFCVGIMYLLQERQIKSKQTGGLLVRLPSLEILDELNYRSLTLGFPLLTVGIVTGSVWASYAWGSYWSWDPKETWSLITWFLYAALLHQRLAIGWRGKKAAMMAIVGFLAVLFTFLGVNLVLSGLHSYSRWS
ncbi:MAG: c-type cytochrome biogenesis protein CcsB [Deltaproteobacteria bacterium]|nr:c-type cytochrome biogenesis protein CcsB [Deltaproteobacteria bacterium]MBW2120373.1 c-type cytochrome biogenesis protein CcsB [Deltaproteobacteria bacterium]